MQNPGSPRANRASAAPVVAVWAGVLWPLPSSSATAGLGQEQHADGGGDDEGEDGAQAARHAVRGTAPAVPVDQRSARSGVTTDITVTATTP